MRLLFIGIHTRPMVVSAKKVGHEVYSVDYFGSTDLKAAADRSMSIVDQRPGESMGRFEDNYSPERLMELSEGIEADRTILTTTLDDFRGGKIAGTPVKQVTKIKDKAYQLKKLESTGIRIPKGVVVDGRDEAVEAAREIGYPCVLKPVRGGGGRRNVLVEKEMDIPDLEGEFLLQEYVQGLPVSASCLSTGRDAVGISTSTQILGSRFLNQTGFAYCGNMVPLERGGEDIIGFTEEIARKFQVVGWTGVDFVLSKNGPVFMELNPRFQGTFDCVEAAYGINLVEAHLAACQGDLPERPRAKRCSVRMTYFSKNRAIVKDTSQMVYDVPVQGVVIEAREPITTVVCSAPEMRETVTKAKDHVYKIQASIDIFNKEKIP